MKKIIFLMSVLASSSFAMKVESFGDSYFSINGNSNYIYLKNKENNAYSEDSIIMNLLNKNMEKGLSFRDNEKDFEITPYVNYIGISNVSNNYNAGLNIMKHMDEHSFGINANFLTTKYIKNKKSKSNKEQVNLFYTFGDDEGSFIISPYYYRNSTKSNKIKNKNEYIGFYSQLTSDLSLFENIENLKYSIGIEGYRQLKIKNRNDVINGNIGLIYQEEFELNQFIIKGSLASNYIYNFKDTAKNENFKDKVSITLGINLEKDERLNIFLENEFKKALNNNKLENISTIGIRYKF